METIISDAKLVFPEFKFFKDLYVPLNISEYIVFSAKNDKILMMFSTESEFYRMYGEMLDTNSSLFTWLKEHSYSIKIKLSELQMIAKCLKKNAIEVRYDDTHFIYKFYRVDNNDELIESEIRFEPITINIDESEFKSSLTHVCNLTDEFLRDNICDIYLEDENIVTKRTNKKLLEIPVSKLDALLKNGVHTFSFSDPNSYNQRYVCVSSKNDRLLLTQYMLVM